MREMLEPIFGETGAIVAQYVITLVVILGLVALVVWLVRRYAVGGISTATRGRLPRLAIVDALVVDNRHRLVLIRRDNVEHLILIGGATDLLIEPSIVRTRLPQRPGQAPQQPRPPGQPAAAPAPPPPAPPVPPPPTQVRHQPPGVAEDPIPFPPRAPRTVGPRPSRVAATRLPVRPPEQAAAAPSRETASKRQAAETETRPSDEETELPSEAPPRPAARTGNAPPLVKADTLPPFGDLDEPSAPMPDAEPPEMEHPSAFAPPRHRPAAGEAAFADEGTATAEEATAPDQPAKVGAPSGPAPKVSDLEKEMARLLGEISSSRPS